MVDLAATKAALPLRAGVIEGFFGTAWPWPARRSSIDFLAARGFGFYVYAPKADGYLRRRWSQPLPADTVAQLRVLRKGCREKNLAFGIGLTPFEIYRQYDAAAKTRLRDKVSQLNELAPDLLCILFDDMRGDLPDLTARQVSIVEDICAWSNAAQFIMCPTYYSFDPILVREFGKPADGYLEELGASLDPRVQIFWTGERVISPAYPALHLRQVTELLRRRPFLWANHLSNDTRIRCNHLYLDAAGEQWELDPQAAAGIAVNPMAQPHLARIALAGFAARLHGGPCDPRTILNTLGLHPCFELLLEDWETLQSQRLDQMEPRMRDELLARYAPHLHSPYAGEVLSWLRGDYAFDPQCLTS
jgi:hypothetical protein